METKRQIKPGENFGLLTVIERGSDYIYRTQRFPRWICRCDCDKETIIRESALKRGDIKSCGCARITANKNRLKRVDYRIEDSHVVCTLTNGVSFLIDASDLPRVQEHGWSYNRPRDYIFANSRLIKYVPLSRFILEAPPELEVDHINHDRLDNRRCNLRFATRQENCANTRPTLHCSSGYKGVSFCKQTGKWRAFASLNGRSTTVGRFDTPKEAAVARDKVVRRLHGEFAWLNFPNIDLDVAG